MIITLTFKSPDVVDHVTEDLDEDEAAEVEEACKKFVKYGEYVYIDIDTDTGKATVQEVK